MYSPTGSNGKPFPMVTGVKKAGYKAARHFSP
jgi:hypothetical protein